MLAFPSRDSCQADSSTPPPVARPATPTAAAVQPAVRSSRTRRLRLGQLGRQGGVGAERRHRAGVEGPGEEPAERLVGGAAGPGPGRLGRQLRQHHPAGDGATRNSPRRALHAPRTPRPDRSAVAAHRRRPAPRARRPGARRARSRPRRGRRPCPRCPAAAGPAGSVASTASSAPPGGAVSTSGRYLRLGISLVRPADERAQLGVGHPPVAIDVGARPAGPTAPRARRCPPGTPSIRGSGRPTSGR